MPWAAPKVTTTTLPNAGSLIRHSLWFGAKELPSVLAEQWQLWSVIAVVLLVLLMVKTHDARRLARSGLRTSSLLPLSSCCSTCGTRVSDKVREYCLGRPRRFGGKIYCYRHQRSRP